MLKPLPYDLNALEPHIGRQTVKLHFEKHHAGYARKLKELIAGKPEQSASLESMVRRFEGAIFNQAAQVWNHDFYWRSMRPDGGGAPSGALNDAITRHFGSFECLRREFIARGASHFGSGWIWLVLHGDSLKITTTPDADLPARHGETAILCADLWEHAYYLDYHDERARYLETFVDHLANWEFAKANWSTAAEGSPTRPRAGGVDRDRDDPRWAGSRRPLTSMSSTK